MRTNIKRTALGVGIAAVSLSAVAVAISTNASAAPTGSSVPSSVVTLPATSRVVEVPGQNITNGQTITVQATGTGAAQADPGSTSVMVRVTGFNPTGTGTLVVHGSGTGAPGNPTVAYTKGSENSGLAWVKLNDAGQFVVTVNGAATHVLVELDAEGTTVIAPPAAPQKTFTAVTTLTNRPDSGTAGNNWAVDTLTRTATLTEHGTVPTSNCGPSATEDCHLFTFTLADQGSFVSNSGATPGNNGDIHGTVPGSITGGETGEFFADGTPDPTLVATPQDGEAHTTGEWFKQFFTASSNVTAENEHTWGWTYNAFNTCEQWVNAKAGNSGDITGVNAC
jgi:hypothetical protein